MKLLRRQGIALLSLVAFLAIMTTGCRATVAEAQATDIPSFKFLSTTNGDLEPPTASRQQSASQVFDVDLDGTNDIVIGSRLKPGPYLVWYRYTSSGWQRYLIEDAPISMSPSGTYMDVDRDGDLDVIMGGSSDSFMIWWWENPYPDYDPQLPWKRYTIKTSGETKHHDMLVADFNNDGKPELAFWNQYAHVLNLAELPEDPKSLESWPLIPIYTWEGKIYFEGLEAVDIDGDGLLDLAGAGRWLKNEGSFRFSENLIDRDFMYDSRIAVGQIIPGGRLEVVMSMGDEPGRLKWYQWDETSWKGHDLGPVERGHSLQLVDINQDNHLDIFVAEMRLDGENSESGMWFYLGDGQGTFRRALIASGYDNHENRVVDLDGDGDLDILGKPFNHETPALHIWLNQGMPVSMDSWNRHVVDGDRPWRSMFISAADVDGDQYADILTGGWWYQNPKVAEGGWKRMPFGEGLNNLAAAYDFDGDGSVDVLGTQGKGADANSTFVWASNDGEGTFTIHSNIEAGSGTFLQGVAVDRFSGEGLGVALSWHNEGSNLEVIDVPADPRTQEWTVRSLSSLSQTEGLAAGDIDRDGLADLLLGKLWLRNASGQWPDYPVMDTDEEPDRNLLADINGDGRLDAVIGFEAKNKPGKLAWYEQPQQSTDPWIEHLIAEPAIIAPMSVSVADMDEDGDLDVIGGEHNTKDPQKAGLFIFQNVDGRGTKWLKHTVYVGDEHHAGAQTVDIDNDGDLDIISIGWNHANVVLYENLANPKAD